MTPSLVAYSTGLFAALFAIGTGLCVALYKGDYKRYFSSDLWVKTYYWIPIFIVFQVVLVAGEWAAATVIALVAYHAIREARIGKAAPLLSMAYALMVVVVFAHLALFFTWPNELNAANVLLIVGFSSVLSDVCAYFFGNFLGRHRLPAWINPNKYIEGVIGQAVGALIGFALVSPLLQDSPGVALAVIIGVASATGDIINSIVKRRAGIKDWGRTIPGHGGVLDRFASLSLAVAAAFWFLVIAG